MLPSHIDKDDITDEDLLDYDVFIGAKGVVSNATARIPFEDMDCFMVNGPVPYPYICTDTSDQV